jgi:hypothetical protein
MTTAATNIMQQPRLPPKLFNTTAAIVGTKILLQLYYAVEQI